MGGVDSSKWKPRRTAGTVINKTRNQFAWKVITGCTASFAVFYTILTYFGGEKLKKRFHRDFGEPTEEEIDRKNLMRYSLIAPKRGDTIRQLLEEEELDQARK